MAISVADNVLARNENAADLLEGLRQDIANLRAAFGGKVLMTNLVANVASIAAAGEATQDVTVTGAAVGDFVEVVIVDATPTTGVLADGLVRARVSAADTVTITIANVHAATALDLSASASFNVKVIGAPATNALVQLPAAKVSA
jgi:hypothetical protein